MSLRLIEIILPEEKRKDAQELFKDHPVVDVWYESLSENLMQIQVLLPTEETQPLLDLFRKHFSTLDGFKIILLPVEASIPRIKPAEEEQLIPEEIQPEEVVKAKPYRISREELYTDIESVARFSKVFLTMVILSAIVAAIGISRNNIAVVIGAMVIAPLLGPNIALSLATTLGDGELARKALNANAVGSLTALVISVFLGLILTVDPTIPEIASRTEVGLGDIALGLAAGSAGALAFTSGLSTALTGVMVAVALLPPLVTFGLLLGAGYEALAVGALLLLVTNLICVNLAGVATFLVQGIRPITWWEADRAKKATKIAMSIWVSLLMALVVVILLSQRG